MTPRPVVGGCLLVLLLAVPSVHAQQTDPVRAQNRGTAVLTDWPESLPGLLDEMGPKAPYLLPELDSMALEYRYAATDTSSQWSFVLSWRPGAEVLHEGDVMPMEDGPADVQMVNIELRAEVRANGERVGEMIVAVDSMALRPLPSVYSFEVTVSHRRVFLDTPPSEARRALLQGASLHDPVIERVGFAAGQQAPPSSRRERGADARRQAPDREPRPRIYEPRTPVLIGWRIGPRSYYVGEGGTRRSTDAEAPRSSPEGRTTSSGDRERASDSDGGSAWVGILEEDDEDDEDDTSLRTPALVAAAAVGVVAFAGGTVGVYGQGETPIGLASGYTHPSGGVQMQAAVNPAVIEGSDDQKLSLKALGFYDVFGARAQPALGLGVRIDPDAGRDVEPSVSGGVVGNLGRFVLYGGVDVAQVTPEFGLAYNIRYGGDDGESSPNEGQ